jgi:hypothetical protein
MAGDNLRELVTDGWLVAAVVEPVDLLSTSNARIVDAYDFVDPTDSIYVNWSTKGIRCNIDGVTRTPAGITKTLSDRKLSLVTVERNGIDFEDADEVAMSIDKDISTSYSPDGDVAPHADTPFTGIGYLDGTNTNNWNGYISMVAIWDKSRKSERVFSTETMYNLYGL